MHLNDLIGNALKSIKSHSPEILTALGASGVLTTSYLVGKASFQACRKIDHAEFHNGVAATRKERFKERTKLVWKLYIPPAISGVAAIGCIIGAGKAHGSRTAAAVTAYSLTERAFSEYKEKVVEEFGKNKEQKIRDNLAQDQITRTSEGSKEVIIAGSGPVLCCELLTARYFRSDMETLRRALNDINAMIIQRLYVTLDEFYDIVGLPSTSVSNSLGWDSNKLLDLQFSSVLTSSGEPCLAFEYNYTKPLS